MPKVTGRVLVLLLFVVQMLAVFYYLLQARQAQSYQKIAPAALVRNQENDDSSNSFTNVMGRFPVTSFVDAITKNNQPAISEYTEKLIDVITSFVVKEPLVPVDDTCKMPTLPKPECTEYPDVFDGKRSKPAKMAVSIQYGFDVDTLEVALHQYLPFVDKIFLLESVRAHKGFHKPLIWEKVRNTPRFAKFSNMVVHLVLDDSIGQDKSDLFGNERQQENIRWPRIMAWNKANGNYFGDDDVISFGDTDEIPSLENLNLLKHCKIKVDKVDVGIWVLPTKIR